MPGQAQHKASAQAKAYMGKVRAWSEETGDGSYRGGGRKAKAKCFIAQFEMGRDNLYLAIVTHTRYLTSIPADPCLAQ